MIESSKIRTHFDYILRCFLFKSCNDKNCISRGLLIELFKILVSSFRLSFNGEVRRAIRNFEYSERNFSLITLHLKKKKIE